MDFYSCRENYTIKPQIKIYPAISLIAPSLSAAYYTNSAGDVIGLSFNDYYIAHNNAIDITDKLVSIGDITANINGEESGIINGGDGDLVFNNSDKYFFKNNTSTELFYNRQIENSLIEIRYIKEYKEPTNDLGILSGYAPTTISYTSNIEYYGVLKEETISYIDNMFSIKAVNVLDIFKNINANWNQNRRSEGNYDPTTKIANLYFNENSFNRYNTKLQYGIDVFNLFNNINFYFDITTKLSTTSFRLSLAVYPLNNAIINLKEYQNYYDILTDIGDKTGSYVGVNKNKELFIYNPSASWENVWSSAAHQYNWQNFTTTFFYDSNTVDWTSTGSVVGGWALTNLNPDNTTTVSGRLMKHKFSYNGEDYLKTNMQLHRNGASTSQSTTTLIINYLVDTPLKNNFYNNITNKITYMNTDLYYGSGDIPSKYGILNYIFSVTNAYNINTSYNNEMAGDYYDSVTGILYSKKFGLSVEGFGGMYRYDSISMKINKDYIYIGYNGMSVGVMANFYSVTESSDIIFNEPKILFQNNTALAYWPCNIIKSMHITSETTSAELKSFVKTHFSICGIPTGINNSFTICDYANANILSYDQYDNGINSVINAVLISNNERHYVRDIELKVLGYSGTIWFASEDNAVYSITGSCEAVLQSLSKIDNNIAISFVQYVSGSAYKYLTMSYSKPFTLGITYGDFIATPSTVYSTAQKRINNISYFESAREDETTIINTASVSQYGFRYNSDNVTTEKEANNIISKYGTAKEKITVTVPFLYDNYDILNYVTIKTDGVNLPVNWTSKEFQIIGISNSYENQTTTLDLKEV